MSTSTGTMIAVVFFWLGLVAGISFLEAPLKFRAPDVTPKIGLGIGRLVFRALNTAETILAIVLVAAALIDPPSTAAAVALATPIVVLVVQLALVRPRLTRRSNLVLAGLDAPHSRSHHAYIALEVFKVCGLVAAGIMLLAT